MKVEEALTPVLNSVEVWFEYDGAAICTCKCVTMSAELMYCQCAIVNYYYQL